MQLKDKGNYLKDSLPRCWTLIQVQNMRAHGGGSWVSDEAPLDMANRRGGILTTLRCYSCALY